MATDLIQSDLLTIMSKPVVAGARIPVELILEKLAEGAGQPHIKLPSYQYLIAIVIIKCCSNTLLSDTALRTLALQQIQRHMSNHT